DEQRRLATATFSRLGLSRRALITLMAATSSAAGAAMLLDACGGENKKEEKAAPLSGQSSAGAAQTAAGGLPSDAAAADKQVLRWPTATDPATMEFNGSYYGGGFSQLWAPLQVMDPTFKVINYACESAEKNADGTVWTYRLRRDAKWTNGQPVTAEDWVYSF